MRDSEYAEPSCSPVRVQLSRKRGWRMPPNTVKVCRPTRWGNPHLIGQMDGTLQTRIDAVIMFERRLTDADRAEAKRDLAGKNLACWCRLDWPCHADVLLRVANAPADLPAVAGKVRRNVGTLNQKGGA